MSAWVGPALQRLAAQPQLANLLAKAAEAPLVQRFGVLALGGPKVPPETLLSVLLLMLLSFLLVLCLVSKARLALWALWYFVASRDKKTRKPDDAKVDPSSATCKRVKIVFIRHGESEWNAVFNEGSKLALPLRLVRALTREALMLLDHDSLFFDSPLSEKGIRQAWDLLTFLASQPAGCQDPQQASKPAAELEVADLVSIIRGDAGESVVVSSILRRAISTGLLSLSPRLLKAPEKEKVLLMTSLQEMSRQVDTLALTPARCLPHVPAGEAGMKNMGELMSHFYKTRLDKKFNDGNKTLKNYGLKRQEQFAKWAFEQRTDCIVICGHSFWFREFFKSYLPKSTKHVAKTNKIVNCGCVAFDFYKDGQTFRVLPDSIKEIYGGFEVKGKSKKA